MSLLIDLFAFAICGVVGSVLSVALHWAASLLTKEAMQKGESDWEYFERTSGHKFHRGDDVEAFCSRCGTSLVFWQSRFAELARSTCPGPYREPWWLSGLRWVRARIG